MNHLQFVALTFTDGSLCIMQIVTQPRLPAGVVLPGLDPVTGRREATDEVIEHEISRSLWPDGKTPRSWRRIEPEQVPQDRAYRNAWRDTGKAIEHDMIKAREICRQRIRQMRVPLMDALDVEYQVADERQDADAKLAVAARKQALRDAPADPRIDAATDTAGLDEVLSGFTASSAPRSLSSRPRP